MQLVNPTPLPGLAFRQFDQAGGLDCVVTLRGTFAHVQDSPAAWSDHQVPLQWQDAYEGDPHQTPMLHQSDLVPGKTGTDVTFLGHSHAPGGPARYWSCGMQIGPLHKVLHVSGPRDWQPVLRQRGWTGRNTDEVADWSPGDAGDAAFVPMDWRLTAGGPDAFGASVADPANPIGCGRIGAREDWRNRPVPAPRISADAGLSLSCDPAGLGPVPPFWPQRHRFAGTYDQAWRTQRHPLLPKDFDARFWNCAPADQIVRPCLRGDEGYVLTNLYPDLPHAAGLLPGIGLAVRVDDDDWIPLDLDGVQFDWRQDALILLTWRTHFPLAQAQGVRLHIAWQWLTPRAA